MCYIERTGGGQRIARAQLVTAGGVAQWEQKDDASAVDQARKAASWIAHQLAQTDRPRVLDLLCVDTDGGVCTWLDAPAHEPAILVAALRQGDDLNAASLGSAMLPWQSLTAMDDATIQALGEPGHAGGQRVAAMGLPDASVRVVLDALDDLNIVVQRVISIWNAMAMVWDPAEHVDQDDPLVVTASSSVRAVVMLDPAGRLIWCWSHCEKLIACGSARLALSHDLEVDNQQIQQTDNDQPQHMPILSEADIGRLMTDWLGWSSQLGVAPSRILCLGPMPSLGDDDSRTRLSAARIGKALGERWAGASVDLVLEPDPVGVTLDRLCVRDRTLGDADEARVLVGLSHRSGRAHRSLYRWGAMLIVLLGILFIVGGVRRFQVAALARESAGKIQSRLIETLQAKAPEAAFSTYPGDELQKLINKLSPAAMTQSDSELRYVPIMEELATISLVVARPDVTLKKIDLRREIAMFTVSVPSTAAGESLIRAMDDIAGSHVRWTGNIESNRRGQDERTVRFTGTWDIKEQKGTP